MTTIPEFKKKKKERKSKMKHNTFAADKKMLKKIYKYTV